MFDDVDELAGSFACLVQSMISAIMQFGYSATSDINLTSVEGEKKNTPKNNYVDELKARRV